MNVQRNPLIGNPGLFRTQPSGATAGTYGDSTHVPQFTLNSGGYITAAADVLITGAAPSGPAGGALSGTYPNPALAPITVAAGPFGDATTAPRLAINAAGQVTSFSAVPISGVPPGGEAGGKLAGTYPNPSLAAVGAAATGPFGDATHAPTVSIDADGRVVTLTDNLITGTTPGGAAGGDLTGTYPDPTLATTGVTAGTYTSPDLTVDAKGRLTSVTSGRVRTAEVSMTLAQFTGMFATPVEIIPAPGVGAFIVVHFFSVQMTYGSAQLANGGNVTLQYGTTAALGGQKAGYTVVNTIFTGWTTSSLTFQQGWNGFTVSAYGRTVVDNKSITISNDTAAFTVGTGATFKVSATYSVYT